MNTSPYSAPVVPLVTAAPTEAEAIRLAHIKHEAMLRVVAALHFIGGAVLMIAALVALPRSKGNELVILAAFALLAILTLSVLYAATHGAAPHAH